jgi:DnaJ homolog subfamily A member 2
MSPSDGDRIVLEKEADQTPDQEPGDLVFILEEKPHDVFKRAGADLMADLHITLAESLCGFSRVVIKHLDGRGIYLNHQKPAGGVLRPGQLLKIENEGMPIKKSESRGDLFLNVIVDFPEDDWLQDENLTSKLKELLPKPPPPITADEVDEVDYSQDAKLEEFGSSGGRDDEAWADDDEEEGTAPQCAQQ